MSCECCESSSQPPARVTCPHCQQKGDHVGTTTLLHHLAKPWQQSLTESQYYFCAQPGCDVVYFTADGVCFNTDAVRTAVGQKSSEATRTLCYCFDIRQSDIATPAAAKQCRDFVIEETRNKACACETRNPSGRCCLRDFPKEKE